MGAPQELITVTPSHNSKPRKARVSKQAKQAIELMVFTGVSRAQAAQAVGMRDDSLYRAMLKTDVLAYMNHLKGVLRTNEAARSPARIAQLADSAESESVRFQANQYLINLNGEGPQADNQLVNQTNLNLPGLTIVYNDHSVPKPTAPELIEATADQVSPRSTRHPALDDE